MLALFFGKGGGTPGPGRVGVVGIASVWEGTPPGPEAPEGDGPDAPGPSASPASPVPLAIARSMLSLGIEASLALRTAFSSVALAAGSPPPSRAATMIARASLENCAPRRESTTAFLCLMLAHLECPDMDGSLRGRLGFPLVGETRGADRVAVVQEGAQPAQQTVLDSPTYATREVS